MLIFESATCTLSSEALVKSLYLPVLFKTALACGS